jgi:hypothetical protein
MARSEPEFVFVSEMAYFRQILYYFLFARDLSVTSNLALLIKLFVRTEGRTQLTD